VRNRTRCRPGTSRERPRRGVARATYEEVTRSD
jgi:hypothetical protein